MEKIEVLVPDTSVIIESIVSEKIKKKEIVVRMIIIHEAVLAELEHQANLNKAIGFLGLDEIKRLKDLSSSMNFDLKFEGTRPKPSEIKYASLGEIDSLIRQIAYDEEATLITSDKVQYKVAESKGMKVIYIEPAAASKKILKLEKFFDETTMSAHLRQDVVPVAKKGVPGNWQFVEVRKTPLEEDELHEISREIIEEAKLRKDSFIEIERPGSTIVQLGHYRIVITKPPFADGWEITAVRPVRSLTLEDYKLSEKLMKRIAGQADGILVAGAPGMGKSTFAQALAIYYADTNKIVKTIEAPRDMILPDKITQYSISHGDQQEIHDILLLSRPDYTVFDEMRNTKDFMLFADLRLAGVGMVGVVHGTNPIDAIQRFLGRVEMGVIPQIVDTVTFIKNGTVNKVLSLQMTVKVPAGMTEADLARPIVVVSDFETGKPEFEIYSYGEQTVVVPVSGQAQSPKGASRLAAKTIQREIMKYADDAKVEVVSEHKAVVYVPENDIGRVIGKEGSTISAIEETLGISIDVKELGSEKSQSHGQDDDGKNGKGEIPFNLEIKKNSVLFVLDIKMQHKDVDIYIGDNYLLTAKTGAMGIIKVKKDNKIGKTLINAYNSGERIKVLG